MQLIVLSVCLCVLGAATDPQAVYINQAGSDDWGEGSPDLPYASIGYAYSQTTTATSMMPMIFHVGAGVYSNDFAIKPWITLQGSTGVVTIASGITITFDSAWDGIGSATAWFNNLLFAGPQTFTMPATANATLFFFPCRFNGGATFTTSSVPNSHQVILDGSAVFRTLTIQDIQTVLSFGGTSVHGFPVVVTATLATTTLWGLGGSFDSGLSLTSSGTGTAVGQMRGCAVQGTLTLSGVATSYLSTIEGVPRTVSRVSGASAPVLLIGSNAMAYTAGNSSNWQGSGPTTVQSALDTLSARLTAAGL